MLKKLIATVALGIMLGSAPAFGAGLPRGGTGGGDGGTGDVVGPAGATTDAIPCFDGATGKLIKECAQTALITFILDDATGDQIGLNFQYTVNKATSGNDTGFLINMINDNSPGVSHPFEIQVNGLDVVFVNEIGEWSFDFDGNGIDVKIKKPSTNAGTIEYYSGSVLVMTSGHLASGVAGVNIQNGKRARYQSAETDGASQIGTEFVQLIDFATAGAIPFQWKNAGSQIFALRQTGSGFALAGDGTTLGFDVDQDNTLELDIAAALITASQPIDVTDSEGSGTITLSSGTGTATVFSGAVCICSNTSAETAPQCAVAGTTLTADLGAGTDVIAYSCH